VRGEVAVVVGNHQGERVLNDCLETVASQTHAANEVVVADGASTDRSRSVAEAHGARFLPFPNLGLGYLYNRGVDAVEAEYVLLLNNDVALDPRCVELLASELEAEPARFAADPRQLDWSGENVIHARTTVSHGGLIREYIPGLHLDDVVPADEVVTTVSAHGAAMLARRSMFLELGGFDESFFMEWEDLDLCWRAWLRGWSSVYVPAASLRHRVGAVTSSSVAPRRSASSHHNLMRFALKCLPGPVAARVLLGELLRFPAHPRAIGIGAVHLAAEMPEVVRLRREQQRRGPLVGNVIAAPNPGR
jgi:N-acetylglucosaminyl-diphospho-decaprenol L-rhamnosyltransferase